MRIYRSSHRWPVARNVILSMVAALAVPVYSQSAPTTPTLQLADALREADRHAFANRRAVAGIAEAGAGARASFRGLLPSARLEAGIVRTTDPLAAFGAIMRQRNVTPDAFNPARLNDPAAISNVASGLVIELPILNFDVFPGTRSASAVADAANAAADWTRLSTRADVMRRFYGAALASQKASTLESALGAAEAAERQVRAMTAQGLVTLADALLAEVRSAEIQSQLIGARDDARTAALTLGQILGRTVITDIRVPDELPSSTAVRAWAAQDTSSQPAPDEGETVVRADLQASRAEVQAASANRWRARATLLPRVNSFARYDWNSTAALVSGRKSWTVGVMGSWSLFAGGSELADVARASAQLASATASHEARLSQIQVEMNTTRRGVLTALDRLNLAERVAKQSREAHRLVEKRYVGGLATIAELHAAEAASRGAELNFAATRYAVIDAVVAHRLAIGADPAALTGLTSFQRDQ